MPVGPFTRLSDDARAASLRATLSRAPPGGEAWVFAYGSLMWDPCFDFSERRPATLHGYRRRFNIWSALARGTPDRPGLGVGLEAGAGACRGVVYRLDPGTADEGLRSLWEREVHTAVYLPRWLAVQTGQGPITAIAFVADPDHPQYAGGLTAEQAAALIARASGKYGTCLDYLAGTIGELAKLGIREAELDRLYALATRRDGDGPTIQ